MGSLAVHRQFAPEIDPIREALDADFWPLDAIAGPKFGPFFI